MKKNKDKIVNLMRLAYKANKISIGRTAVEKSIKKNKTNLVFSGKKSNDFLSKKNKLCKKNDVEISYLFDDNELADIFNRKKLTLVSVDSKNFYKGLKQAIVKYKE